MVVWKQDIVITRLNLENLNATKIRYDLNGITPTTIPHAIINSLSFQQATFKTKNTVTTKGSISK